MKSPEDIWATVDAMYAAAVGQVDWHAALDRLAEAIGFTHWSVYAADRHARSVATPEYRFPVTGLWCRRYGPAVQRDYEAEYYRLAPNRRYYIQHPHTRICHDMLYTTEAEMDRNAFYAWAERDQGVRYMAVGLTDPRRPIGATVGVTRSRRRGSMTPAEATRFGQLLDHFERALDVEYHMGKAMAPDVASVDFLECNPTGIVMLDSLGRVVLANRAARAMAERADSFVLRADGISAIRARDDAALQRLAGLTARTSAGQGLSSGGTIKLPRRSGLRDYLVTVSPLSRRDGILSELMPAVCLLITDPDGPHREAAGMLRRAYGLTAAEARLVERLAAGDTPEIAAQALGISLPTARTHLAAVFRKTETGRQSELARLLVSLPWWGGNQDTGATQ